MNKSVIKFILFLLIACIAAPAAFAQDEFTEPLTIEPVILAEPLEAVLYDPYIYLEPVYIIDEPIIYDPYLDPDYYYDPYQDPYYDPDTDPNLDPNIEPPPEEIIPAEELVPPEEITDPPPEPVDPPLDNEAGMVETTPETAAASNNGTESGYQANDAALLDYPGLEGLLIPSLEIDYGRIETEEESEEEPEAEEPGEREILTPVYIERNPRPSEVIDDVVPKVTKSQLNIFLIILAGLAAGTLVWILTGMIINSAQARREEKRMKRQTAYVMNDQKIEQLKESYDKINDAVSALSNVFTAKGKPAVQISDYKKASVELELFASGDTLEAHKEFINLISASKPPSQKEFNAAKSELLQSLKQDLGL